MHTHRERAMKIIRISTSIQFFYIHRRANAHIEREIKIIRNSASILFFKHTHACTQRVIKNIRTTQGYNFFNIHMHARKLVTQTHQKK